MPTTRALSVPTKGATRAMPTWLTYREIAERLGITRGAAKMLVARRGWTRQPPNRRGGIIRILVPDDIGVAHTGHGGNTGHSPAQSGNDVTSAVPSAVPIVPSVLTQQAGFVPISVLEQIRADHNAAAERARADHAAEIVRVQSLHLDLIGRIQAQASVERSILIERIDASEIRAESAEARAMAVDEKLNQILNRLLERQVGPAPDGLSWWARWFGATKRSNIR